jgi:hypothetical protein
MRAPCQRVVGKAGNTRAANKKVVTKNASAKWPKNLRLRFTFVGSGQPQTGVGNSFRARCPLPTISGQRAPRSIATGARARTGYCIEVPRR